MIMAASRSRKYFIAKHGLDAFQALPGFIWRTGIDETELPPKFNQVKRGDRWVEFAYIKDEIGWKPRSFVMGFCECVREAWYGDIPKDRRTALWGDRWDEQAWMIEGKLWGEQPQFKPVAVPPINEILGRTIFGRGAIIPGLHSDDLERIRCEALRRELNPELVPYLKREPWNEQEVLAIVVADVVGQEKRLGIDEIVWARTRSPDMLVRINGKEVYLELEFHSLGFGDHIEKKQLRRNSDRRCSSKVGS
jgi:hypothetical protein